MDGWIKLNRKLINSVCFKDSIVLHIWIFLLLDANHGESKVTVGNQVIIIKAGQMLTSRKRIAEATGIQESKVERILTLLKAEQQIEQQSFTKYRIISICKWDAYQNVEQQIEQQVNSKRTASEHIKEGKEEKEVTLKVPYDEIMNLYNSICLSLPKAKLCTDTRKKHIKARWDESGKTVTTFKELFEKAEGSGFLRGDNKEKWVADFDFLMRPEKFNRVLEGNYGWRPKMTEKEKYDQSIQLAI